MTDEKKSRIPQWLKMWKHGNDGKSKLLPGRRKLLFGLAFIPAAYALFQAGKRVIPAASFLPGEAVANSASSKNILIITGSARVNGNSDQLAEAFARGARSAGHEVAIFRSAHDRIEGCIACDNCWSGGKPCVFDDGFDKLAPMLEKAETLVLCGPLYWYSFSTHLKSAIDKMYSYSRPGRLRSLKIKEAALLMCGETWFEKPFEGPVASFRHITRLRRWTNRGVLLVTRVHDKGEIANTDGLQQAEKMGRKI